MKEVDTFVTVENVSYLLCDRNTFTTAKHLHSTFLCVIYSTKKAFTYGQNNSANKMLKLKKDTCVTKWLAQNMKRNCFSENLPY